MLLSDNGWLWARGFEGGGPHVALYRRIAHWLMKEPALEEEALRATAEGRTLAIERQTMADSAPDATVKLPSGETRKVPLTKVEPGLYRAELKTGTHIVVDALGDDYDDLDGVAVKIVPPPAK